MFEFLLELVGHGVLNLDLIHHHQHAGVRRADVVMLVVGQVDEPLDELLVCQVRQVAVLAGRALLAVLLSDDDVHRRQHVRQVLLHLAVHPRHV